jgi:hypothetical protein
MTERRFPPPWSIEEQPACFVVRDQNGQALAYVYFEDEPGRRSAAKLFTKEAAGAATEDALAEVDWKSSRAVEIVSDRMPLKSVA